MSKVLGIILLVCLIFSVNIKLNNIGSMQEVEGKQVLFYVTPKAVEWVGYFFPVKLLATADDVYQAFLTENITYFVNDGLLVNQTIGDLIAEKAPSMALIGSPSIYYSTKLRALLGIQSVSARSDRPINEYAIKFADIDHPLLKGLRGKWLNFTGTAALHISFITTTYPNATVLATLYNRTTGTPLGAVFVATEKDGKRFVCWYAKEFWTLYLLEYKPHDASLIRQLKINIVSWIANLPYDLNSPVVPSYKPIVFRDDDFPGDPEQPSVDIDKWAEKFYYFKSKGFRITIATIADRLQANQHAQEILHGLESDLFEVSLHGGISHYHFNTMTYEQQLNNITEGRKILESMGYNVFGEALPGNQYNVYTYDACINAGMLYCGVLNDSGVYIDIPKTYTAKAAIFYLPIGGGTVEEFYPTYKEKSFDTMVERMKTRIEMLMIPFILLHLWVDVINETTWTNDLKPFIDWLAEQGYESYTIAEYAHGFKRHFYEEITILSEDPLIIRVSGYEDHLLSINATNVYVEGANAYWVKDGRTYIYKRGDGIITIHINTTSQTPHIVSQQFPPLLYIKYAQYKYPKYDIIVSAPSNKRITLMIYSPKEPKLVYAYGGRLPEVASKTGFDSASYDCWYYDPSSKLLYIKVTAHSDVPVTVYYTWTAGEVGYTNLGYICLITIAILVLTILVSYIYVKKTKH